MTACLDEDHAGQITQLGEMVDEARREAAALDVEHAAVVEFLHIVAATSNDPHLVRRAEQHLARLSEPSKEPQP